MFKPIYKWVRYKYFVEPMDAMTQDWKLEHEDDDTLS